jgi:hypothetical protein
MGNAGCCCRSRSQNKFVDCETMKDVVVVIKLELKRIHQIVLKLGHECTTEDDLRLSLKKISDRTLNLKTLKEGQKGKRQSPQKDKDKTRETFYYYLKLEMILLRVKYLIEEISLPRRYQRSITTHQMEKLNLERETYLEKESSTNMFNDIRKKRSFETTDIEEEENTDTYVDSREKSKSRSPSPRRKGRARTQRVICKVNKNMDMDVCIEYLLEVLKTEESVKASDLEDLEMNLEKRLFKITDEELLQL